MSSTEKNPFFELGMNNELSCSALVIDNFYTNPDVVRKFALEQDYYPDNFHPGVSTHPLFNREIDIYMKNVLTYYSSNTICHNNPIKFHFQYNTVNQRSCYNIDNYRKEKLAAILYLTPDAPYSAGTGFFKYENGIQDCIDETAIGNELKRKHRHDDTKWELNTQIGNVYNRLVIFNADQYHKSLGYFGNNKDDARLIQIFCF